MSESLTLQALVSRHPVVLLGPLVEEVGVAVPREPDPTVDLDVLTGDEHGGLTDEALAHRRGLLAPRVVDVRRPRRVVSADARELESLQHVDGLVTDGLEARD